MRWSVSSAHVVLGMALLAGLSTSTASARIVTHLSWRHPVLVDPSRRLATIACSSASLCVAADESENVVTSTDPARGAWKVAHVYDNQGCGSKVCSFQAISGPSKTFCSAMDNAGCVFTSTRPAAGAGRWSAAQISRQNDLTAISCPLGSAVRRGQRQRRSDRLHEPDKAL
jgi:hypothetical protein